MYRRLCHSSIPYTQCSLPYTGKPEKVGSPAAKYYITGKYFKYLINELPLYCNFQGINTFMDHYYLSVSLTTWALEKKNHHCRYYEVRQGTPKELKPVANREESNTNVCNTKQKTMLVSYVDKKRSGKKNATVLSIMHDHVKITKDQQKKPSLRLIYDHTKGGVDVVDLLSTANSTRIKSRR